MPERKSPPRDTIPETRAAKEGLSPVPSGVRRLDDSLHALPMPPDLEQIRAAMAPGTSIVIADYVRSGVRYLWSVWLGRDENLIVTCWDCQQGTEWKRGTSFALNADSVMLLEGLLSVRRDLRRQR